MKRLLTICLLLPLMVSAQYKVQPLSLGAMYLSGASKGLSDALMFHYDKFQSVHPNANHQFWNPSISWTNKYKNNDPAQGERFLGSSTVFVTLTDGWHLTQSLNKCFFVSSFVLKIGNKNTFKNILYDFALYSLAYSAGFWTTYELIYR